MSLVNMNNLLASIEASSAFINYINFARFKGQVC